MSGSDPRQSSTRPPAPDPGGGPLPQAAPAAVRVLAAVIRRADRWLLCRRPAHKRHGGFWEFPGGKLEAGESLYQAAVRELAEELGIEVVTVGRVLHSEHDPGSPFIIEFVEVAVRGEPRPLEHEELRWVTPAEAEALPLAPADRVFVSRADPLTG